MRGPKVGEMWQLKTNHKMGSDVFFYVRSVGQQDVKVLKVGKGVGHWLHSITLHEFKRFCFYVQ